MDLFTAVTEGNLEAVQGHIAAGLISINVPQMMQKSTPLMIAIHLVILSCVCLIDARQI